MYWLREDCSLTKSIELPKDIVIGPTGDGSLIVLEKGPKNYSLSKIISPDKKILITSDAGIPCGSIAGVAMTSNEHILAMDEDFHLLVYSPDLKVWEPLKIPCTTMLWEAFMDQD